ncbi:unnamed protein product [Rotaria magnacalcarata]|uniref:Pentapeptide repeat-containing protein n=1 Tax=Rotaria magnacalcarata TaxID=392030 RepID=A0A8S3BLR0_9BILA|nr:unnamed protein product [Rotaria magnacalcarata]CAF4839336.1 unnamed protein product [Rotaria magnacalcarata]
MLERNQGSLTNNTVIAALARVKTLSIVRQLDSNDKSGQLTPSQNPLDLSTADLNNMNMNSSVSELPIVTNHTTSLSQAEGRGGSVNNNKQRHESSFVARDLTGVNFQGAYLIEAQFGQAILTNSTFSNAILTKVNFLKAYLKNSDFSRATITEADVSQTNIDYSDFS